MVLWLDVVVYKRVVMNERLVRMSLSVLVGVGWSHAVPMAVGCGPQVVVASVVLLYCFFAIKERTMLVAMGVPKIILVGVVYHFLRIPNCTTATQHHFATWMVGTVFVARLAGSG